MQAGRNKFIIFFAIILILFGTIGAIASVTGIFIVNSYDNSFGKIQDLGLAIVESLERTSGILEDANTASAHIAESIRTTKGIINYSSVIIYDSGIAFEKMSDLAGFEILGLKPLVAVEDYFKGIGDNMVGLSGELDKAAVDMDANASDLDKISGDLETISVKLGDVAAGFNKTINSFSVFNLILVIKCLLAYLGIFHIIFVLNGIMFLILKK